MKAILIGAFGGISTNLFRLAVNWVQGVSDIPEVTYWLGLILFAILGGIMVAIWKETDLKKAFYIGIGLPAIFQIGIGEINLDEQTSDFGSGFFVMEAYAETLPQNIEDRTLEIKVDNRIKSFTIEFSSPDSTSRLDKKTIPDDSLVSLNIPSFATQMRIFVSNNSSNSMIIPDVTGMQIKAKLSFEEKSWTGFMQAIGIKKMNKYDIILQKIK